MLEFLACLALDFCFDPVLWKLVVSLVIIDKTIARPLRSGNHNLEFTYYTIDCSLIYRERVNLTPNINLKRALDLIGLNLDDNLVDVEKNISIQINVERYKSRGN